MCILRRLHIAREPLLHGLSANLQLGQGGGGGSGGPPQQGHGVSRDLEFQGFQMYPPE